MPIFRLNLPIAFLAAALVTQAAHAQDAEPVDLFDTARPNRQGLPANADALGMAPETVGAVGYFTVSTEADRSLRSGGAPRTMRIALPDGGAVTCNLEAAAPQNGVEVLRGSLGDGDGADHCYLLVKDGQVTGDIQTATGRYRILPAGPGNTHAVVEMRTNAFPAEGDVVEPPVPKRRGRSMIAEPLCDVAGAGDRGTIDLMVLYTPAAAAKSDMEVMVAEAMTQLKDALIQQPGENFGVNVRLVHSQQIDYVEGADLGVDLERLTGAEPGQLAEVPVLRDRYKADIVHMIVENNLESCGLGWMIEPGYDDSADYAFSVSERVCAVDNFSFAHEVGHNIGMNHDRYVVENAGDEDINFGFVSVDTGRRTLMAYDHKCQDIGKSCPRILTFSTPAPVMGGDTAWGVPPARGDGAYNREILCRNAPGISQYR
ncbi:M12 family metallo-peptidase [Bauldia litoralis]|uniref:M12 family metallo-peptidase n=1 Tax=Bauldia litoralis TaxID=665467 RepID=UPI00326405F1